MSVQLRPMTEAEFAAYLPQLVEDYAGDLVRARGEPVEAARRRSAEIIAGALPDGRATADNWFYVAVVPGGTAVGRLWLGLAAGRPQVAVVCDIEVLAAHRGQGHGRAVLDTAEAIARSRGCTRVELNVFAFNDVARRLYESAGYRPLATQLGKTLAPAGS